VPDQAPDAVLDAVGNLSQSLAGLDVLLRPLADLAMCFGRLSVIRQEVAVEVVQMTLLLASGTIAVLVDVLNFLAVGIVAVREQLGYRDRWRIGLCRGSLLLLLGLLFLVLLLFSSAFTTGSGGFDYVFVCIIFRFSPGSLSCSITIAGSISPSRRSFGDPRLIDYDIRQLAPLEA